MIRRLFQLLGKILSLAVHAVAILFGVVLAGHLAAPWIQSQFDIRLPAGHDTIWLVVVVLVLLLEIVARRQIAEARQMRIDREVQQAFELVKEKLKPWAVHIEITWFTNGPAMQFRVTTVEGDEFEILVSGTSRMDSAARAALHMRDALRRNAARRAYSVHEEDEEVEETPPQRPVTGWWTTLGVPRNASLDQVNRAWRKLSTTVHPDRGGTEAAMAAINVARDEARKELRLRTS